MGVDDSRTLLALKAHRRELIDPKIDEYGGRIVKSTGDGLLLEFPSVVDAVRCAVDVQRGMAERNAGLPAEQRLDFRIGINVGDIIIDGDDIHGDGVNVAARLQALAEPGGICASRVVRDQVLDKLSFAFEDLGAQRVKNIARPIEVYRVDLGSAEMPAATGGRRHWRRLTRALAWPRLAVPVLALILAGIGFWSLPRFWNSAALPTPPPMSIAILPFATPAGGAVEKQSAEALRHDLTTVLAAVDRKITTVQVDAASDGPTISRESGRRLNARYVAEGDVRRGSAGNIANLRVVDVGTGAQLWGEQYDLPDSATSVQSAVKRRKIVAQIAETVDYAETRRVLALPLERLNAMELVLRGQAALNESATLASMKEARKLYDDALRLNPNFVPALVARTMIVDFEKDLDPNANAERAAREMEDFSARALRLDINSAQVWRARSVALSVAGRWTAALQAADQAIALDPYNPQRHVDKAYLLNLSGRPADALRVIDQALAMEPTYAGWGLAMACFAHLLLDQPDEAIVTCEKAAPNEPTWMVQLFLVAAYANHGDLQRAAAAKERVLRIVPGYTIAQLRAKGFSKVPEYVKLAEMYWYPGLRKAGIPEN